MINDRLKLLREDAKLTQLQVAERFSISKNSISEWEKGKSSPSLDKLPVLARLYKTSIEYILTGRESKGMGMEHQINGSGLAVGRVPLISLKQACIWGSTTTMQTEFTNESITEWVETTEARSECFALMMVGDSMLNPHNQKSLSEGMVIIIDTAAECTHRSIVVAQVKGQEQAVIRQLIIEGSDRYLTALNPQYPLIVVNDETTIIGVAIKAQFSLS